jgi:hypothetical protein
VLEPDRIRRRQRRRIDHADRVDRRRMDDHASTAAAADAGDRGTEIARRAHWPGRGQLERGDTTDAAGGHQPRRRAWAAVERGRHARDELVNGHRPVAVPIDRRAQL